MFKTVPPQVAENLSRAVQSVKMIDRGDHYEILGWCKAFDPVEPGAPLPAYRCTFDPQTFELFWEKEAVDRAGDDDGLRQEDPVREQT